MKKPLIIAALLGTAFCLTGCGHDIETDTVTAPENAVAGTIVPTGAATTPEVIVIDLNPTEEASAERSSEETPETASGTGTTAADTTHPTQPRSASATVSGNKAPTAGQPSQGGGNGGTGSSGGGNGGGTGNSITGKISSTKTPTAAPTESRGISLETLAGNWETVTFSENGGSSIPYNLSFTTHRNNYVGIRLSADGKAALVRGSEELPAAATLSGKTLTVSSTHLDFPETKTFTVSEDGETMTADVFGDGRIIAEMKRLSGELSVDAHVIVDRVADIKDIIDDWYFEEQSGGAYTVSGYVNVDHEGNYVYQPVDGSPRRKGTVSASGGSFSFTQKDGTHWISAFRTKDSGDIYETEGGARLRRRGEVSTGEESYVGTWECDPYTIRISREGEGFRAIITADGYEWSYNCTYNPDFTGIECTGGGTLTNTADGTVVYSDGTAGFRHKNGYDGGYIRWDDDKEDKGFMMEFMPYGWEGF